MCGISGIISAENSVGQNESAIGKVVKCMSHRGPDARGIRSFQNGAFGHNRLAIIDLDPRSNQPMECDLTKNLIVFNGEIYNFQDLRRELEYSGFDFRTNSDTEVLLKGFAAWNDKLWSKLDGFFSIALWENKTASLRLVRDPFGIKPLYYGSKDASFYFSSEMKPLIQNNLISSDIDYQSISDYFTYSYVCAPKTPFKNIKQVEPGTFLVLNNNHDLIVQSYWRIEQSINHLNYEENKEILLDKLKMSINASLISDVPVGLLLSGGVDSNIIFNLLNKSDQDQVQCITATFSDDKFDEGRIVKEAYGERRNLNYVDGGTSDVLESYLSTVKALDTLNSNTAAMPEQQLFSGTKKNNLKVMLTGSGLDEMFGGYITYRADVINRYYSKLPTNIRKIVELPLSGIKVTDSKYPLKYLVNRFTSGVNSDILKSHVWWRSVFTPLEKVDLIKNDFLQGSNLDLESLEPYKKVFNAHPEFDDINRLMVCDLYRFLGDNANLLMDNISMAHSIETRPSFLNKDLVNFAFSLHSNSKIGFLQNKKILRETVRPFLPTTINKQKKSGLVSPLSKWFKGELKPLLHEIENSFDSSIDFIDGKYIKKLFDDHYLGKANNSIQINSIVVLKYWMIDIKSRI